MHKPSSHQNGERRAVLIHPQKKRVGTLPPRADKSCEIEANVYNEVIFTWLAAA